MEEDKITEKKNQHFVPRFYLKRFSVNGNDKEVRLFNIKQGKFISSASLANQAFEKYYYGKDGVIEDSLANSETIFAEVLKKIVSTEAMPNHASYDHRQLLHFAVMTEYRNPVKKMWLENLTETFGKYAMQRPEFPEEYRNKGLKLQLTDPVLIALAHHKKSVLMITDLQIKLLKNNTATPFITSDNPVVQYNQFLEQYTQHQTNTGYGIKGLQIFIPISPKHLLLFYDSQIYYVGKRKSKLVEVNDQEVDNLNLLQLCNANQMCYGNEAVTEAYLTKLFKRSKTLPPARQQIETKIKSDNGSTKTYQSESSCRTKLNLSFVTFSTHASRVEFRDDVIFYPREFALEVEDAFKNDLRFRDPLSDP